MTEFIVAATYPRNARSFCAPVVSPADGSSGTCSSSSVGKYEVSVIERRRGMNGASIWRIAFQFTPRKNGWFLIPSTARRRPCEVISLRRSEARQSTGKAPEEG